MGLAGWRQAERIDEPNLQALLGIERLAVPGSTEDGDDIPVTAFPTWHHCTNCQRLLTEEFCRRKECERPAPPSRFVIACRNGHLDDFPWIWWVHRGPSTCQGTTLELDDSAGSNSLGDLWVRCREHKVSRSLRSAMEPDAFAGLSCPGRRPWLGDTDPRPCDKPAVGVLRGASNVWFPDALSALSLPRHASPVYVFLKDHFQSLRAVSERVRIAMLEDLFASTKFTVEEGLQAIEQQTKVVTDARDLRREEYDALVADHGLPDLRPPAPYFEARDGEVGEELVAIFDRIVLVDRLREVNVLRGFTRLEGPDPDDPARVAGAPITVGRPAWLPAREVFGEGLFFRVSQELITAWQAQAAVSERAAAIDTAYAGWRKARDLPPAPHALTAERVALHAFAHLMIRGLSLACGYGISSLRERIYTEHGARGFLIYTASADSDGSLGGLVAMGEPARLAPVVSSAIEQASWCSQDPLCAEREPDPGGHVSGAACHSCLLLPETSCELGNRFLDRLLLIGGPGFRGLLPTA